jgi:hypothetical protein
MGQAPKGVCRREPWWLEGKNQEQLPKELWREVHIWLRLFQRARRGRGKGLVGKCGRHRNWKMWRKKGRKFVGCREGSRLWGGAEGPLRWKVRRAWSVREIGEIEKWRIHERSSL